MTDSGPRTDAALDGFPQRVAAQDISLYDGVPAQLEPGDRRSLLALHAAAREVHGSFCWLEIGSHLGGSLQVLVRDPACTTIVSIDPRPPAQPDERGYIAEFADNSTARMLGLLSKVPGAVVDKVHPIEATSADVDPTKLPAAPQICFIDGEHTDSAVQIDARFCAAALGGTGVIAFHDAAIVYRGISTFIAELRSSGVQFTPYFLPSTVFVIELGPPDLLATEVVTRSVLSNWEGYLFSLQWNNGYRDFFNQPVFRWARSGLYAARVARRKLRARAGR